MRCVLVDERKDFLQDVQTRLILDDGRNVEICAAITSPEKLANVLKEKKPEAIIVSSNIVDMQEDWDYSGVNVYGYAATKDGEEKIKAAGLPSYGYCKNSSTLLNMMETEPAPVSSPAKKKSKPVVVENDDEEEEEEYRPPKKKQRREEPDDEEEAPRQKRKPRYEEEDEEEEDPRPKKKQRYVEEEDDEAEEENDRPKSNKKYRDEEEEAPRKKSKKEPERRDDEDDDDDEDEKPAPKKPQKQDKKKQRNVREEEEDEDSDPDDEEEDNDNDNDDEEEDESYFNKGGRMSRSAMNRKDKIKKAKVVTVYAAKGGVGKTTIASNLAVYLGLTSSGRGKLKVCVIDYNIDFGDVRSVLGFPMEGPDMSMWNLDIQERLDSGESPKNIKFSKNEIFEYLQKMEKTDVYALLAPLTHEESMEISGDALEIMIRNIVNYGGFDFVVCDTGNNTRDSSVYALEFADTILLISTTDATTVTCNVSAMEALDKFGLDMKKIRLVLNNCMSRKATGISAKEVEDELKYPCIARIPFDVEVIRSNNVSIPIVYQAKHEVTAAFRKIVGFLLGTPAVEDAKPKGFFAKLFGKKEE